MIFIILFIIIFLLIIITVYNNKTKTNNNFDEQIYLGSKYIKISSCFYNYNEYYPELTLINNNREKILDEFNNLINSNLWISWVANELELIQLYSHGHWSHLLVDFFPESIKILKQIPKIKNISFSKLSANKQLMPHKDWGCVANNILRCHYGLIVPDKCGSIIENWIKFMENDEWLVLDISKIHTSFNFSNEDRYIMIIDMERPNTIPIGDSNVNGNKNIKKYFENFFTPDQIIEIIKEFNI